MDDELVERDRSVGAAVELVAFGIFALVDFEQPPRAISMWCVAASTPITLHKFVGFGANALKAEVMLPAHENFGFLLTCLNHNDTAHMIPVVVK